MPAKRTRKSAASEATAPVVSPTPAGPIDGEADILGRLCGAAPAAVAADVVATADAGGADAAAAFLINAVCACGGAREDTVVEPRLVGQDPAAILEEIHARMPHEAPTYTMIAKDARSRKLQAALPAVFTELATAANVSSLLTAGQLMTPLLSWLYAIGESKSRSFRHAAAAALMGLLRGVSKVIQQYSESMKAAKKRDAAKLQRVAEELNALHEQIFLRSLHNRVKDVSPDIRLDAFRTLKELVVDFPEQFAKATFLRYLTIALYDKKSEVRFEGLSTLTGILSTQASVERNRAVVQHFTPRVVDMCTDTETRVAELAIEAASLIVQADFESEEEPLMKNESVDVVLLCLMDDRKIIRSSAGRFLHAFIHCRAGQAGQQSETSQATLLMRFVTIMKDVYKETILEKYIVDSLWCDDAPPPLLAAYQPFISFATGEPSSGVSFALNIFAAMLERTNGPLDLGPIAKDDARPPKHPKISADQIHFRGIVSRDIGRVLPAIMTRHANDANVVQAACQVLAAMDLAVFESSLTGAFTDILAALRKATSSVAEDGPAPLLSKAWSHVAFTDHPHRLEAESQLMAMTQQIMKQAMSSEKREKNRLECWLRASIVAGIVPQTSKITELLDLLSKTTGLHVTPIAACAYSTMLFLAADAHRDEAAMPAWKAHAKRAAEIFVNVASSTEALAVIFQALDLAALVDALTEAHQAQLVDCVVRLFAAENAHMKVDLDQMKSTTKLTDATEDRIPQQTEARRVLSHRESVLCRLACGMERLFALRILNNGFAAKVLLQWPKSVSKSAADAFKSLFYTIRADAGDDIERTILLAAFEECIHSGMTPAAIDDFGQMGAKLASLHMALTDKHYAACLAVVTFGLEYAQTTDPTFLHAIVPYASRLRVVDAAEVARRPLALDHPHASAFVAAVRRAARLDEPSRSRPPSKRIRESAAIDDAVAGVLGRNSKSRPSPARMTVSDGWRVKQAISSQPISSLADDDVLLSTQEFE